MTNINEVYLKKCLKGILKLEPQEGLQIFFTGAYNYIPADPKSNVHANDYYLYVKVFNECCKEDQSLVQQFSVAIEQFLEKSDIVNAYIAYEILVSQMRLTRNGMNGFEIDNNNMIDWFNRINSVFMKHKENLRKIQYGIAELYENGLEEVIRSSSSIVDEELGVKLL
jgi:hypothetical protein